MGIGDTIAGSVWVLIPLFALGIPLSAVIGATIVRPIVHALTRLADADKAPVNAQVMDQRFTELDDRLARIERHLARAFPEPDTRRQFERPQEVTSALSELRSERSVIGR
jgi:hypothetical protein